MPLKPVLTHGESPPELRASVVFAPGVRSSWQPTPVEEILLAWIESRRVRALDVGPEATAELRRIADDRFAAGAVELHDDPGLTVQDPWDSGLGYRLVLAEPWLPQGDRRVASHLPRSRGRAPKFVDSR